jgi:hypothetical protein
MLPAPTYTSRAADRRGRSGKRYSGVEQQQAAAAEREHRRRVGLLEQRRLAVAAFIVLRLQRLPRRSGGIGAVGVLAAAVKRSESGTSSSSVRPSG